jgi:hypothetical protein
MSDGYTLIVLDDVPVEYDSDGSHHSDSSGIGPHIGPLRADTCGDAIDWVRDVVREGGEISLYIDEPEPLNDWMRELEMHLEDDGMVRVHSTSHPDWILWKNDEDVGSISHIEAQELPLWRMADNVWNGTRIHVKVTAYEGSRHALS